MAILDGIDRTRAAWWATGAALFFVLAYIIHYFIGTFVFGVFIYYATRPVYRRIHARLGHRNLSALLSLLVLALPALLLLAYTLAIGLQEFNRVAASIDLGALEAALRPYINIAEIVRRPSQLFEEPNALALLQTIYSDAMQYLGFIGNLLLHLFVMITIAFYLLRDDQRLARWFQTRFVSDGSPLESFTRAVDRDFSNIFFGNILNAALTAVIGAIAYNTLAMAAPAGVSVPYPTLLGLLTGVASLIPVIGMKLVYFPVTAWLLYLTGLDFEVIWFPVLFAGVSFVIVDVIPDLVLRPYVSGRNLHLGMVMLAYIFGPLLFGWYGIFLGPMLLVLIVHFTRLVLPELLLGLPIEPESVDPEVLEPDPRLPRASPEGRADSAQSTEDSAEGPPSHPDETVEES